MTISSVPTGFAPGDLPVAPPSGGPAATDSGSAVPGGTETASLFSSLLSQLMPATSGQNAETSPASSAAPAAEGKAKVRLLPFTVTLEEEPQAGDSGQNEPHSAKGQPHNLPVPIPAVPPPAIVAEVAPLTADIELGAPSPKSKTDDAMADATPALEVATPLQTISSLTQPTLIVRVRPQVKEERGNAEAAAQDELSMPAPIHALDVRTAAPSVQSSQGETVSDEAPIQNGAFAQPATAHPKRPQVETRRVNIESAVAATTSETSQLFVSRQTPLPSPQEKQKAPGPQPFQSVTQPAASLPIVAPSDERATEPKTPQSLPQIEAVVRENALTIASTEDRPPAGEPEFRAADRPKPRAPELIPMQALKAEPEPVPALETQPAPSQTAKPNTERILAPEPRAGGDPVTSQDTEIAFEGRLIPRAAPDAPNTAERTEPTLRSVQPDLLRAAPPVLENSSDRPSRQQAETDRPTLRAEPSVTLPVAHREIASETVRQPVETPPATRPATAEPAQESAKRPASEPVREISMRINDPGQETAHLRVVERGGEVLVSVRSGSEQLARTLSSDLGDLSHRLEQTGYQSELWRPAAQSSSSESSQDHRGGPSTSDQSGNQATPRERRDSQDQPGRGTQEWWDELDESMSFS